jgi:hypothetical protein
MNTSSIVVSDSPMLRMPKSDWLFCSARNISGKSAVEQDSDGITIDHSQRDVFVVGAFLIIASGIEDLTNSNTSLQ